jgi:tRNA A37 threonylcarbamoyladenosine synthetase subunit TsaC/SUA5/YrdC
MGLQQLLVSDKDVSDKVLSVLNGDCPVFMLQLPSVYALVAPSTTRGVEALNRAKCRIPGKIYGSAVGELSPFMALAIPNMLPNEFRLYPNAAQCMEGSFMRLVVDHSEVNTSTIEIGTHQGLLMPEGHIRDLFRIIERSFQEQPSAELFPGKSFTAPLCTSANISGDPLGSIVTEDRALRFAEEQGISLVVRSDETQVEKGSYPIFYFRSNEVTIERRGPRVHDICAALPKSMVLTVD